MKNYNGSYRPEMEKRVRNRGVCYIMIPPLSSGEPLYYNADSIRSLTTVDEVDPLSRSLPTETLTFEVFDYSGRLNPDNPNGYFSWFEIRRPVYLTFGILDDNGLEHTLEPEEYFITEQPRWNNYVATFQAVKILGLLEKTNYYGSNSKNLYDLAEATERDAGLSIGTQYGEGAIDVSLKDIKIFEWNHSAVTSHADTLLQIAAASKCSVRSAPYSSEIGSQVYLRNEYLSHDALEQNGFLGVYFKDMFSYPSLQRTPSIKNENIALTYAYYNFAETDEPEVLASYSDVFQTTELQTVILQHSPIFYKTVDIENGQIENDVNASFSICTVVKFYPNNTRDAVNITVKGYAFGTFLQQRAYLIDANGTEDDTVDNSLIVPNISYEIAKYRGDYLKNRNTYIVDYRGDPSIEVLDIIYVQLPYLGARKCLVLRTELTYNGAYHGKLVVKLLENLQSGNPAIAGIAIAGIAISGAV